MAPRTSLAALEEAWDTLRDLLIQVKTHHAEDRRDGAPQRANANHPALQNLHRASGHCIELSGAFRRTLGEIRIRIRIRIRITQRPPPEDLPDSAPYLYTVH